MIRVLFQYPEEEIASESSATWWVRMFNRIDLIFLSFLFFFTQFWVEMIKFPHLAEYFIKVKTLLLKRENATSEKKCAII